MAHNLSGYHRTLDLFEGLVAVPLRAAGHLAAQLTAPPGADEQTRLLAFLGRAVPPA